MIFKSDKADSNPVLIVSQKTDSLYQPVKWIKLEKNQSSTDYKTDLLWGEDGDYKLQIIENQIETASDYFSVDVNEDDLLNNSWSDDYNQYNDPSNTFYYIDSKVEFYNKLSDTSNFYLSTEQEFSVGNVTVYVTNNKPIITDELKVSVYLEDGKKEDLIEEKSIPIISGVLNVSFQYYFGNKGTYLVSVYTKDDIWINDGTIKIKK